jgi:thiamine pyrophosphokinase
VIFYKIEIKISENPSNPLNQWSHINPKSNKMSSHHIIRDAQEPALIIANGEACSFELLGELLEWSPLVIVLDSAINRVLELGIKIDVLLGDFDRDFDAEKIRQQQYPIEIVHTPDQNKTDLEKAFDYLIDRNFPAVNVIWATGRRADHTITNITSVVRYREQLKIVILDDYSKVFLLPQNYEKWYPAGTPISLIPIGKVDGITTKNLKYSLDNESLIMGYRSGSSNEALKDGIVSISHESGDLLLMECWD